MADFIRENRRDPHTEHLWLQLAKEKDCQSELITENQKLLLLTNQLFGQTTVLSTSRRTDAQENGKTSNILVKVPIPRRTFQALRGTQWCPAIPTDRLAFHIVPAKFQRPGSNHGMEAIDKLLRAEPVNKQQTLVCLPEKKKTRILRTSFHLVLIKFVQICPLFPEGQQFLKVLFPAKFLKTVPLATEALSTQQSAHRNLIIQSRALPLPYPHQWKLRGV